MPEQKESKSNKHFQVSVVKSILRMLGCGAAFVVNDISLAVTALAVLFLVAEVLGIVEEL